MTMTIDEFAEILAIKEELARSTKAMEDLHRIVAEDARARRLFEKDIKEELKYTGRKVVVGRIGTV